MIENKNCNVEVELKCMGCKEKDEQLADLIILKEQMKLYEQNITTVRAILGTLSILTSISANLHQHYVIKKELVDLGDVTSDEIDTDKFLNFIIVGLVVL